MSACSGWVPGHQQSLLSLVSSSSPAPAVRSQERPGAGQRVVGIFSVTGQGGRYWVAEGTGTKACLLPRALYSYIGKA